MTRYTVIARVYRLKGLCEKWFVYDLTEGRRLPGPFKTFSGAVLKASRLNREALQGVTA